MANLRKLSITITGITPLIMHSDRLANPMDPIYKKMKEISCIKQKKDEHRVEIAKIEFEAGLYYHRDVGIYMPSKCLMGCIKCSARKFKWGKLSKAISLDAYLGTPLIGYEGVSPEQLWDRSNSLGEKIHVLCESVVVSRCRVMRTRPIFPEWANKFDMYLDTDLLSIEQFKQIVNCAGYEYGLCELRPEQATGQFGKFEIDQIQVIF